MEIAGVKGQEERMLNVPSQLQSLPHATETYFQLLSHVLVPWRPCTVPRVPPNTETTDASTCSQKTTICTYGHIINFCYVIQVEQRKERESKRGVERKFPSMSLPNFVKNLKGNNPPPEYLKKSRLRWGRKERLWDSISYQDVSTEKTPDQKQCATAGMDAGGHRSLLGPVGRPEGTGPGWLFSSQVPDNESLTMTHLAKQTRK